MILTHQKTIDESCVSFFENLFFLNYQEKMVFPFWNWASSRKSSWTFPLPIRENRLTRPVSTSLTLERWALSDEFQRPINCCATRSTAPWSRARWAILSNTGKWTRNETLYDQHLNLFQITKNLKLVSFSPPPWLVVWLPTDLDTSNCASIPAMSKILKPVWLSSSLPIQPLKNWNLKETFSSTPMWSNEPKFQSKGIIYF